MARRRAAALDAEFERLVTTMSGTLQTETLGAALTRLRDHLVTEAEGRRAAREPDGPGTAAPGVRIDLPPDLIADLVRFAQRDGAAPGDDLPADLAARVIAARGAAAAPPAVPTPTGASTARAQRALGRAGVLRQALRANDITLADETLGGFTAATGFQIAAPLRPVLGRYALLTMSRVEEENARRERGIYPGDGDPVLGLPALRGATADGQSGEPPAPATPAQGDGAACPPSAAPSPEAITQPASPDGTVAQIAHSTLSELRTDETRKLTTKVLSDYRVALDLFTGICGDIPISDVTPAVAKRFVKTLHRVPAGHGKSRDFRDMKVAQAIEKADALEQTSGRREPRLSMQTINKHLTSLQTLLGAHLPLDRHGKTPIVAARIPKAIVRANPSFERRGLTDERLGTIFQGPAFTGFSDHPDKRFKGGDKLLRDARYWVPLVALFSGACLEEILQLAPEDIFSTDGIPVMRIGAVRPGEPTRVKTPFRRRVVPVHSTLRKLGLLEYAAEVAREGSRLLFPGFAAAGPDARLGHKFTQWWTNYRRALGAYVRGQDFHSLRHGVNTRLQKARVPTPIVKALLGHSAGNDISESVYMDEAELPDLAAGLEALSYPALDLDLLHARAGQKNPGLYGS